MRSITNRKYDSMVVAVVLVKRLETEYSRDINFMNLVWCYICSVVYALLLSTNVYSVCNSI